VTTTVMRKMAFVETTPISPSLEPALDPSMVLSRQRRIQPLLSDIRYSSLASMRQGMLLMKVSTVVSFYAINGQRAIVESSYVSSTR
jgi:hypothetical protein